jgi:hypothetical protein
MLKRAAVLNSNFMMGQRAVVGRDDMLSMSCANLMSEMIFEVGRLPLIDSMRSY